MFLRPGRRVRIGGPRNHFALGDHERYIFIAGGIGITPILAMAHHVAAATREWTLFYAGRSTKSMAFLDELAEFGP
jgi:ferredoxin-NADP reductase